MGQFLVEKPALPGSALSGNQHLACLAALAAFEAFGGAPAAFAGLFGTLASADRLFALLDRKPNVVDPDHPSRPPDGFDLVLNSVGLIYPEGRRPALAGIDLVVKEGARVAIIGASGAGKSSLANLLVRFRDPTSGEIRLGGELLPHLASDVIRSRIAVVGQSSHLFSSTVADNLRLARPQATPEDLWSVLATVRLEETIRALPNGLDTYIGVAGTRLSGGQARRLTVARALLTDASVLVLDEPTEGLDPETERQVINGILDRTAGRTLLLLTHRLAGLDRMDEIVTLDAGQIIERGRFQALTL